MPDPAILRDAPAIVLTPAPRPAGQRAEYRFVTDPAGRKFKAARSMRDGPTGDQVMVLTVSQVDAEGKALVDALGTPQVVSHSHTFTQAELTDPAFSVEKRVAVMLAESVETADAGKVARKAIADLETSWPALAPAAPVRLVEVPPNPPLPNPVVTTR